MKVVVGYEMFGRVRDAFIVNGHEAISIDLEDTESPGPHFKGDMWDFFDKHGMDWDLGIFFPPCTYVCGSGWHHTIDNPERLALAEFWMDNFTKLWTLPIPKIAIENPVGVLSRLIKPTQYIQPYEFGEDASKKTCLWLKNLPLLKSTKMVMPRIINGKKRWANQTDSGQNKLGPSENRAAIRGMTYQGIANAMGIQWS